MDGSRTVWRVLLIVVVVGLLIGAGFALYRWGYSRGAARAMLGEMGPGSLHMRFPGRDMPGGNHFQYDFKGRSPRGWGYPGHYRFRSPLVPIGMFILGVAVVGGVIFLVVRSRGGETPSPEEKPSSSKKKK